MTYRLREGPRRQERIILEPVVVHRRILTDRETETLIRQTVVAVSRGSEGTLQHSPCPRWTTEPPTLPPGSCCGETERERERVFMDSYEKTDSSTTRVVGKTAVIPHLPCFLPGEDDIFIRLWNITIEKNCIKVTEHELIQD